MIRRLPLPVIAGCVLLLAACPSTPAGTKISFKGKALTVEWIRTDPARMLVPREHSRLTGDRGFLVGYGHDRLMHHYSTGSDGGYDIAWLSKDRKVVETALLNARSEEGVTSTKEARYALFLPVDWLKSNGAAPGDVVDFGSGITGNPPEDLPEIRVGGVPVQVELAITSDDRQRGLMHRTALSDSDGMLFVFRTPHPLSFWMGNCHFPLDIAYFDAEGKFLNVVLMETYPDPKFDPGTRAPSKGDAKYVLEVNLGWFNAHGLTDKQGGPLRPIGLELPGSVRDAAGKAE